VRIDVVQIEYSLLKRDAELSGLLSKCKELGVTPVPHSPLAQGLLTDFALEREDAKVKAVKPLLQLLQFIGAVSGGKAIEQVHACILTCCMRSILCTGTNASA
jgi:aryl-alcohol dehydrogenase-like predicted oxidoreductase